MKQLSISEFKKRVYDINKKQKKVKIVKEYKITGKRYLTRKKNKSISHILNGNDTYCRMWSTNGLSHSGNWEETWTTKKDVCKMCLIKYYERHKSLPEGIESDQFTDLYKQVYTSEACPKG